MPWCAVWTTPAECTTRATAASTTGSTSTVTSMPTTSLRRPLPKGHDSLMPSGNSELRTDLEILGAASCSAWGPREPTRLRP